MPRSRSPRSNFIRLAASLPYCISNSSSLRSSNFFWMLFRLFDLFLQAMRVDLHLVHQF